MTENDYRIFRKGEDKSHIYVAGESTSIAGCQTLRHYDSEELPRLELSDTVADMCQKCAKRLWGLHR